MNEATRTLTYVGVAAVSVVLAAFLAPATPRAPDEFGDVGRPFYADFIATDAAALTVVSFNEESTQSKVFNVQLKDGKWVIGSHRDYPADGKDRLAKTAASVIGIKKEQFATKDSEQYASLQVVDPLDEDSKKLKGRGQRVTLKDASGKVLADYIIGKRVPNRDSYYYIRRPDEKSVYMAKLNIDLSTKFADWIESDLLQLQGENLTEVAINKYSIDKKKGRLTGQETNILKRAKPADPWTLDGLDAEKEEVNQDEIRTMTTALDDLKILGVREKPEGLSADLKTDKGIALDLPTQRDLASKGFYFQPDGQLICDQGEMISITDAGVAYTLRFGEVFIGSELDMETGLEADQRKQDEKDGKKDKAEEKGSTKSRYVFITAHFDPQAIGPKPVPPGTAAPEKPAADAPAEAKPADAQPKDEKPAEDKPAAEKPADEKPAAEDKSESKPDEAAKKDGCQDEAEKKAVEQKEPEKKAAEPADAETQPEPKKAAAPPAASDAKKAEVPQGPTPEEAAKAKALEETKKYEQDLKAYNEKVEKGQKKVKELNARFADWYYVISEENFLKLRLSRASLVKEKAKAEPKPGESAPGEAKPGDAKPDEAKTDEEKPEEKPAADAAKPEAEKPKDKPADEAKPEEKKSDEKKPEEPKAEEKKPEEKPAENPKPEEKKPE